MEALHSVWCRAGCASRVSLLSVPKRGLLLQTEAHFSDAENTRVSVEMRIFLAEALQVVPARRRMSETLACHLFNVLLEVQHPVQAHAKVRWSLLKHQAFVIDKHVQFPFSFSVIEVVGGRTVLPILSCRRQFRR